MVRILELKSKRPVEESKAKTIEPEPQRGEHDFVWLCVRRSELLSPEHEQLQVPAGQSQAKLHTVKSAARADLGPQHTLALPIPFGAKPTRFAECMGVNCMRVQCSC